MTKALLVLVLHLIDKESDATVKTNHGAHITKPMQSWITFDTQLKIYLSEQIVFTINLFD